jgi:hypothetical protein
MQSSAAPAKSGRRRNRDRRGGSAAPAAAAASASAASAVSASSAAAVSAAYPNVRTTPIVLTKAIFSPLDTLEPDSKGKNLTVLVLECKPTGSGKQRAAEALVGDATGTILLNLDSSQINSVRVGQWLNLRNVEVEMVNNHMHLIVTQWSVIEERNAPANTSILRDNNLSLAEYELVTLQE